MTPLLVVLGFIAALGLGVLRALVIDQVRGQIQRRIIASVESTIASLPAELQAEWGDEWRAELAAAMSMPFTAARYARGLHHSATRLRTPLAEAAQARIGRPVQAAIVLDLGERGPTSLLRPRSDSMVLAITDLDVYLLDYRRTTLGPRVGGVVDHLPRIGLVSQ